jgi:hypothetical protein
MNYEKELTKSMMNDVHSASKTIYPDTPIPIEEFQKEVENLDFYEHGAPRGSGWSAVTVYGIGEEKTDHPSKYGIETPENYWCLETKAPKITEYFRSGKFFKNMRFKRIRIMRLDPKGLIRSHSDNMKNSLSNAINIELGPTPPEWVMLSKTYRSSINLWPGRTYLFNNHFYHTVFNPSDNYRYQIIVHSENIDELASDFIRSGEDFIRGVWTDNEERDHFALWSASGKSKGSGLKSVPYVRETLEELQTISNNTGKLGLFFNGKLKTNIWIKNMGGEKYKKTPLYEKFLEWKKENRPTFFAEDFVFYNPEKRTPEYFLEKDDKIKHIDILDETLMYWIYSTDAIADYESPHHKNRDFDLVISPATGTYHEYLMSAFNCHNALAFDNCENNLKIFKKIREYFKEEDMVAWEKFEKYTKKCCDSLDHFYKKDVAGINTIVKYMQYVSPLEFNHQIKKGNYEYILLDLVKNPEILLPYVENKRVVINTSNIFSYLLVVQNMSWSEIMTGWDGLISVLHKSKYTYFIGEDPYKVNKRFWIYGE